MIPQDGSVSVFLVLVMMLILSVTFAFLESARVSALKTNADLLTMQSADCLMAEYHKGLWEDYGLLGWRGGRGESGVLTGAASLRQTEFINADILSDKLFSSGDYYWLDLKAENVIVKKYELMTDHKGAAFRADAVRSAKYLLAEDALAQMKELLGQHKSLEASEETIESLEQSAISSLDQMKEASEEKKASAQVQNPPAATVPAQNPIIWMKNMKKNGILSVVLPGTEISEKQLDESRLLTKGNCNQGNYGSTPKIPAAGDIWFRLYLDHCFLKQTDKTEGKVLDYELEYLLAGKLTDKKNLKTTARRLLLLREAANYGYLMTDAKKQQEALAVALAISSAFASPEFAGVLKQGILVAWAYAESVSDVRTLYDGGYVPLVKTAASWHTDLKHLASSGGSYATAQKDGLSYGQYLQLMMYACRDEALSMRALTLIGQNEDVEMDCVITRMDCAYELTAKPVFLRLVFLGQTPFGSYTFRRERTLAYI